MSHVHGAPSGGGGCTPPSGPKTGSSPRPHVSWMSLLRTVRAPLFVVVTAGVALIVPPQTQDMLEALSDTDANGVWMIVKFHFSLALLAISAWYWSRALLAARFRMPDSLEGREAILKKDERIDRNALDFIPRAIFILVLLTGIGIIVRSDSWRNLPYLAAWGIPVSLLVFYRLRFRALLRSLLKR